MDASPLTTSHLSPFLPFAHQLADAAGEIIRPYFGAHGNVEAKDDNSPVTKADQQAEAAMRALIVAQFPDHSIFGEEFGLELAASSHSPLAGKSNRSFNDLVGENPAQKNPPTKTPKSVLAPPQGGSGEFTAPPAPYYTWVLDPIDGTRAFIAGRKEWGTLIALCENGVPVLGIFDQPITGERLVGLRGAATQYYRHSSESWNDGTPITTRSCPALATAEISTTSALHFTPPQAGAFVKLAQSCRATVKDGDCYAYGLLARGMRDMVVDAGLKPYDILALVPIIEGAGGTITGWDGASVTLTHFANVLATGDAARHKDALALLGA